MMYVVLYLYIALFNDVCFMWYYICILFCLMMYVLLYLYIVLFNDVCCIIFVYCFV